MDCWNPKSFDAELCELLTNYSPLILSYFRERQRLMHEHLNSDPYESLKQNRFNSEFSKFQEDYVTPLIKRRSIRVWHYTRLLDHEVEQMEKSLVPSTLDNLKTRLSSLVQKTLLTENEAEAVFQQSPLHEQNKARSGRVWTVPVPHCYNDSNVKLLLESWGGEVSYFWMSDEIIKEKLKNIGTPRIVEIETGLLDNFNANSVAKISIQAWAKILGSSIKIGRCDLAITGCLDTAQVIHVHSKGDKTFNKVAKSYPLGSGEILS